MKEEAKQCYNLMIRNWDKDKIPDYLRNFNIFYAIFNNIGKKYIARRNDKIVMYVRYQTYENIIEILDLASILTFKETLQELRNMILQEGYYPIIAYKRTKKNKVYLAIHDFNSKYKLFSKEKIFQDKYGLLKTM